MNLTGPAAEGRMSKSKISVGTQTVAQEFGMSTTPEKWPWTGAHPRIECACAPEYPNFFRYSMAFRQA